MIRRLFFFLFFLTSLIMASTAVPGHASSAGVTTIGTTSYPNGGMAKVGEFSAFKHEDSATCAIANSSGTTAWVGTHNIDHLGTIVQVDVATMRKTGVLELAQNEGAVDAAAIDPAGKYGYFGTYYQILRINLATFAREGHVNMPPPGGGETNALLIDPAGKYAYAALDVSPGRIIRFDLSTLTVKDSLELPANDSYLQLGVMDASGSYAYFVTGTDPASVVRVRLSDFTRLGSVALPPVEMPTAAAIDPSGSYLYIGGYNHMYRVDLGVFASLETLTPAAGDIGFQSINFSPDRKQLFSIVVGGKAVTYDLVNFSKVSESKPSYGAAPKGALSLPGPGGNLFIYNQTYPAIVEKTNFGLQRSAPLIFDGGEAAFETMTQDADGRYAFLGSFYSKAVKFDLDRFSRVSGVQLDISGHYIDSSDSDGRYAYFGTWGGLDSKSHVIKIDMERMVEPGPRGLLDLNQIDTVAYSSGNAALYLIGEGNLFSSLATGYIGTAALSSFTFTEPVTVQTTNKGATNLVVNPNTGDYYYGNKSNSLVIRYHSGTLSYSNPVLGGPVQLLRNSQSWHIYQLAGTGVVYDMDYNNLSFLQNADLRAATGEQDPFVSHGAIDTNNRFAMYATEGALIKHDLINFQQASSLPFPGRYLREMMLSVDGTRLFALASEFDDHTIAKIRLTPRERMEATQFRLPEPGLLSAVNFYSHATVGPRRVGVEPLGYDTNYLRSGFIDRPRNRAWFCAVTAPGRIVSFNTQSRSVATSLSLPSGDDSPFCAAMDPSANYGYFGTFTSPGKVIKVRLSDATRVGALTLAAGEANLVAAAIDPAGTFAYFADRSNPGKIIRVRLSDFTRVGALPLNAGEFFTSDLAIDPAGQFLYALCSTGSPAAGVVKVRLSDFSRVGVLPLTAPQNGRMAMDLSGTYLYAAGSYVFNPGDPIIPATLDRIRLSDFTKAGSLAMVGDETVPGPVAVDPAGKFVLVSINAYTPKIVKVDTQSFTRQGAGNLRPSLEAATYSMLLDGAGQFAYLGESTSPGRIVTFEVAPKPLRLGLYKMGSNAGNLMWQSQPLALTQAGQWLSVPVSQGTPASVKLLSGNYALGWQLDADESAPSFAPGAAGEGMQLPLPYGAFPSQLSMSDPATSWIATASRWSGYIDYTAETGVSDWQDWR